MRQLPDGTCLLGLYYEVPDLAYGAVIGSTDGCKTWSAPIRIPSDPKVHLDAETDLVMTKDKVLYAVLRGPHAHFSTSTDGGITWSYARDIGFAGHCPHLTRLRSGVTILAQRIPNTSVYLSRDGCRTWDGPHEIDQVGGAYPATVELKDGTVLIVYYTEGADSAIRAKRFRVAPSGVEFVSL